MSENRPINVQRLVKMAADRSSESRAALLDAIEDLYHDDNKRLTDRDRALMASIMRDLIHKMEMPVRRVLAEKLAERKDAPRDLVVKLANDAIEVAHPILLKSQVLQDLELIEIVQHRTMEHQLAIAMRPQVTERVSRALVETDDERVIAALLSNEGARLADDVMEDLVDKSSEQEAYQNSLVHRRDLPTGLAKRLYWGVSAALRKHILDNYDFDSGDLDETIEGSVKELLEAEAKAAARREAATPEPTEELSPADEHILLRLMQNGEIALFLDKFVSLTRLRVTLARRILFEAGGEGLAVACRAIGLDKHTFISILLRFRQGRLGDKQVEDDELTRAVDFFDRLDPDVAKAVMRRWRRDPDYLNALRLVDRATERDAPARSA